MDRDAAKHNIAKFVTPLVVYPFIFTFSKQAFNESLEFCNLSKPHELNKI